MSAICQDCGMDCAPHEGGDEDDAVPGTWEWYVLRDEVWRQAVGPQDKPYSGGGILCIGCVETRIGRQLVLEDFDPEVALNTFNLLGDLPTQRLRDRMGVHLGRSLDA